MTLTRTHLTIIQMKTLADIYQKYCLPENGISDKGTTHSYIEEYERLFAPFRQRQPITMLEIGLCRGGSLRMWHEYFDRSAVHGIDISDAPDGLPDLRRLIGEDLPRMTVSIFDACEPIQVLKHIGNAKFDIIIEDASHDIDDSMAIYANFVHRLNPNGLYVIEDVVTIESTRGIVSDVVRPPRQFQVLDLRHKKNRWDDVLITIQ